jgi:GNAT superfamily N-acetyltransferase
VSDAAIRPLDAREAEERLGELAGILVDAVANGASVNFMAGFSQEDGEAFWRSMLPGLAAGDHVLLVAEEGGRLLGTVIVFFARQPNGPHRAEIGKMLVHSSARRRGLGERLLRRAEEHARDAGRSLLVLDTHTGGDGDRLYRRCGWIEVGQIPDHSFTTDGRLWPTTIFYKRVA